MDARITMCRQVAPPVTTRGLDLLLETAEQPGGQRAWPDVT